MIYLDYNAIAPVRPEVLTVMEALRGEPLNPSSTHSFGRKAKRIVEDARRSIAETIGAFANEIIFTGSATEANNWVLKNAHSPLFVSAIEHSSVLKTAKVLGSTAIIPVTQTGIIDLKALEQILPKSRFLLSIMLANNETGVIQPVQEIAQLVRAKGGLLHCDAVQAYGKIPVDFTELGCDFLTISSHKMGGPVGVAALIVKNNLPFTPMITGGGQELNRRAGTENVAAIAGFAKAAESIDYAHMKKLREWLDKMEADIAKLTPKPHIISRDVARLPNSSCITMPNVNTETQLIRFDLENIAVSAGSACSSGRIEPSHVQAAMGIAKEEADTAIRVSGGWRTIEKDIEDFTAAWKKCFLSKNPAL